MCSKTNAPAICLLSMGALLAASPVQAAVTTVYSNAADGELYETGAVGVTNSGAGRAGASGSAPAGGRNLFLTFQIPDVGPVLNPFTDASLALYLISRSGNPAFNVDVYTLAISAGPAFPTGVGNFYEGPAAPAAGNGTLLQDNFATTTTTVASSISTSGDANTLITAYLNAAYNGGAGAGQYAVFRFNADGDSGTGATGHNFAMSESGTTAGTIGAGTTFDPALTLTYIPEPSTALLALPGFMVLLGRRRPA